MEIFLKEPSINEKNEIVKMCEELRNCDDEIKFEGASIFKDVVDENYDEWLQKVAQNKHIEDINPDLISQTTYVVVDETGHVYGGGNLRYRLNKNTINIGGHIGYALRPSDRGKGVGTRMLPLFLDKANERGIEKVLLTCRENNYASARVIEKNHGIKDTPAPSRYEGILESRYWIDVKKELNK